MPTLRLSGLADAARLKALDPQAERAICRAEAGSRRDAKLPPFT